jgi:hypothetical protein
MTGLVQFTTQDPRAGQLSARVLPHPCLVRCHA